MWKETANVTGRNRWLTKWEELHVHMSTWRGGTRWRRKVSFSMRRWKTDLTQAWVKVTKLVQTTYTEGGEGGGGNEKDGCSG